MSARGHIPNGILWLALVSACLSPVVAQTQPSAACKSVETVGVVAEAASLQEAITTALAQGVAQVRGLFISAQEYLKDSLVMMTNSQGHEMAEFVSEYRQVVLSRYSGLILSFEVIQATEVPPGLRRVNIRMQVCLDPGLLFVGDPLIGSQLKRYLASYWKVYLSDALDLDSALNLGYQQGVTLIAFLKTSSVVGNLYLAGDQLKRVHMTGLLNLLDLTSLESIFSDSVEGIGIAYSVEEATRRASHELSKEVWSRMAQALTKKGYSFKDEQAAVNLLFSPITRESSVREIANKIHRASIVVRVEETQFIRERKVLRVRLLVADKSKVCDLARELVQVLRGYMKIELESCNTDLVSFFVLQE